MSLIPKISIGQKTKRNKFSLPCLTHGTSEIGYVSPTYSRNLINNSSFKIGTKTAVRLSPLFVPTMGDLSVRHYHCFVPFNKVWTPFDAFLDKKPFAYSVGASAVPQHVPHFTVGSVLRTLMQTNVLVPEYNDNFFDTFRGSLTCTFYTKVNGVMTQMTRSLFESLFNMDIASSSFIYSDTFDNVWKNSSFAQSGSAFNIDFAFGGTPSFIYLVDDGKNTAIYLENMRDNNNGSHINVRRWYDFAGSFNPEYQQLFVEKYNDLSIPSFEACDFMDRVHVASTDIYICYNFNGPWKRLRSIFLGLGYCFNPFDTTDVTFLKLLAFYRCYWDKFGVNRDVNFQDTYCAKLSRLLSSTQDYELMSISCDFGDGVTPSQLFYQFVLNELPYCTYTTPSDYFSSSVTNTQQSLKTSGDISIYSHGVNMNSNNGNAPSYAEAQQNYPVSGDSRDSAIGIQLALKLLRWVNRNTVVGSKIYDGLRAKFGNIDVNDESSEGVQRIGEDSTSIEIGAIFNQSDNESVGAPLGTFAGVGVGKKEGSDYSSFDVNSFGCFITLTAVVPQMGYFQGMFRENSDGVGDNFEMFDETFDAVGWQTVRYNELVGDRQFKMRSNFTVGTALGNFGLQPRYTHMKCAYNRCVGDISLPHMQDSMLPYTLDRYFWQRSYNLPANTPQSFRSGTRGETNRIFQVTAPTDDHVIYQIYFDVEYDAPMKQISESYDTQLGDDNGSIEVSHE